MRYGGEESHTARLALTKLDGTPLPVMETLQSDTNKIYRWIEGSSTATTNNVSFRYSATATGVSCEYSCIRRDRPSCRYCKF